MQREFFIPGDVPSKKNGKLLTRGRLITDPVKQQQLATLTMLMQHRWASLPPLTAVNVEFTFHVLHRRRDLDNVMSSVLDCMVKAGVLLTDSMVHIERVSAGHVLVRRGDEGVLVTIRGEVAKGKVPHGA